MPIKPENRKLYPKDWKALSKRIREEAGACEFCFVKNYSVIRRNERGMIVKEEPANTCAIGTARAKVLTEYLGKKFSCVVLTVAHLNHDPTDNRRCNLRALCQRCHNLLDAPHRTKNAAETRQNEEERDE